MTINRELSQFASFVKIDDSTKNIGIATTSTPSIGIGTANPSAKFEVVGNTKLQSLNVTGITTIEVSSTSPALRITQTGTGDAILVEDSANPDSSPFVVTETGRVGIGTTNPSPSNNRYQFINNLIVRGNDSTSQRGITIDTYGNSGSQPSIAFQQWAVEAEDTKRGIIEYGPRASSTKGEFTFGDAFYIEPNSSETIGISSNIIATHSRTNIGIGTTNPTSKLHVAGNALITGVGTITTFNSTNGTITNGTITNLTGTAGTITTFNSTTGTITNLNSTTGIITNVTVSGLTSTGSLTVTGASVLFLQGIDVTGTASIDALTVFPGPSNLSGQTNLFNALNVAGITTLASSGGITTTGGDLYVGSDLYVARNANIIGVSTFGNTVVGGATTQLIVTGNARITGILTIGTSSLTLDGTNNQINVGTGVTIQHTNGVLVGSNTLSSTGLSINAISASGIATFTNGPVFIGAATSTGTASQPLQITGGAYVSGSVGIGTTNPGASLHITPTASSIAGLFSGTTSGDMVRITQTGSGNALVVEDDTNPDSTPFVVTNAGRVCIGTTNSPFDRYNVYGSLVVKNTLAASQRGITIDAQGSISGKPGIAFMGNVEGLDEGNEKRGIIEYGPFTGNTAGEFTFGDAFYIKPNSLETIGISSNIIATHSRTNVGIGTTNPTAKLDVIGDARITGVLTATTFSGAVSGTATSTTNIPNLTGAITSVNTATSLGSFSSSNLATALTDKTGSGAAVFATSPTLVTPVLGDATATSIVVGSVVTINASGINAAAGIITASQLSTGASGTGVNISTDTISGPATLTIDPAAVGDNTGAVRIKGDLYVDGTQFIVNSTTIELADFNVGIATTVGTNALLDGAGIGIGSTGIRKTLTWSNSSTALKSSEDFDVASGKVYRVDGNSVLSNNTLGSGVVTSSLTSVGTLSSLSVTGSIELGHASDTTIARVSAGVVSIEGVNIVTTSSTDTLTNKTLTSPTLTTPVLGTPSSGTLTSCTGLPLTTGVTGTLPVANGGTGVTGSTGTGSVVLSTSPTLVTPILGTPQSGTLTSCTGLPVSTGISGLAANVATFLATPSSANLASALTDETGSGSAVFATSPTLVTPVLGTPQSGTLTSCSGLPVSTGISGLGANVATFLATPSSANLISAVTDETGTGALVFATSPTLVTPVLGDATATSIVVDSVVTINASGINATTGIVTATTFQSTSDINLKENIETVNNSLNIVSQLRGVTFDWKNTHQASIGVIAQEVEQILPELVSGGEIKTVNYNGIIGILVEAIKEQQIRIEKLENKLNVQ